MSTEQPGQNVAEDVFFDNKDIRDPHTSEVHIIEANERTTEDKRDQMQLDSELLGLLLEEDEGHRKLVDLAISEGKDRFEELIAAAVDCGVPEETKDLYFDLFSKTCQELQDSFARYETAVGQALQTADLAEPWSSEQSIAVSKANKLLFEQGALGALIPKAEQATARLEPVPDRDPEKGDVAQECLGVDTEQLFEEKALLEQRRSFYKEVVKRILYQEEEFTATELKTVFDHVIEKLRAETDTMEAYDKEGVDLFAEDLRDQPNFPGLNAIKFGRNPGELSKEKKQLLRSARTSEDVQNLVKEDGIVCDDMKDLRYLKRNIDRHAGGSYVDESRRVYVLQGQPTLDARMAVFLVSGGVSGASSTLVHEIRHHRQMSLGATNDSDGGTALMEAQSYVQHSLSNFSERMLDIVRTLTRSEGLYQVPVDAAVQAIEFVERLNAMGLAQEEISELIAKAGWDDNKQKFTNLDILLKEKMKELQIGEADADQLRDVFRVLRKVKQLRIQNIAREELFDYLGEKRVDELTKSKKSEIVPFSSVSNGKHEPAMIVYKAGNNLYKKEGYKIGLGSGGWLESEKIRSEYNTDGQLLRVEIGYAEDQELSEDAEDEFEKVLHLLNQYEVDDVGGLLVNESETEKEVNLCIKFVERLRESIAHLSKLTN